MIIEIVKLEAPDRVALVRDELMELLKPWVNKEIHNAYSVSEVVTRLAYAVPEIGLWVGLNRAAQVGAVMAAHVEFDLIAGVFSGSPSVRLDLLEVSPKKLETPEEAVDRMLDTLHEWGMSQDIATVRFWTEHLSKENPGNPERVVRRRFFKRGWSPARLELSKVINA